MHQHDYKRLKNLCQIAKQKQHKIWHKHWGNTVFTVEIPESESQQGEKTRYIQIVQTHSSIQLSLGAVLINRIINADSKFLLQLTPDVDSKPRDPMQTSVRDGFSMMEVNGRKVWVCLARGSNGSYSGYFFRLWNQLMSTSQTLWHAWGHKFTGGLGAEDGWPRMSIE